MPERPRTNDPVTRRQLLRTLGAGGLGATAMLASPALPAAAPQPKSLRIDFDDPAQNLRAYMRVFTDIEPASVAIGWFGGTVYAVVGDTAKTQALLGIEGIGITRTLPLDDGGYRIFNRELAFYKDLRTGRFIDTWDNPLNGRRVETFPIHNMTVNAESAPIHKMDIEGTIIEQPFNPPWTFIADYAVSTFEIHASVPSELQPDEWPLESPGPLTRISEMFMRYARIADLADESRTSVPYIGTWNRLGSWYPWMLMGQAEGHLFFRANMAKLATLDDVPAALLAKAHEDHEAYLEPPGIDSWGTPNDSTFNMYRKERKPQK
jgi:hypothetical protein